MRAECRRTGNHVEFVLCYTLEHVILLFFFFNRPATTEIYTFPYTTLFRSGKPARCSGHVHGQDRRRPLCPGRDRPEQGPLDRKSTRLNSSHSQISYAVFCLKKKRT